MTTRERILAAANVVALRDGVLNLTLEAVANEAGLSKGGLLYHFPSKEALIEGLVAQFIEEFEEQLRQGEAAEGGEAGSFTRSFVNATFDGFPAPPRLNAALLAAVALSPSLLGELRAKFATWHERIQNDGLNRDVAVLLRYAADGIWISELLGLAPPDPKLRQELHRTMLNLTKKDVIG